jgi:hypothetical protein
MRRFFWSIYYRFRKPVTKSEVTLAYARVNGLQLINLKARSIFPCDLKGVPEIKAPWKTVGW